MAPLEWPRLEFDRAAAALALAASFDNSWPHFEQLKHMVFGSSAPLRRGSLGGLRNLQHQGFDVRFGAAMDGYLAVVIAMKARPLSEPLLRETVIRLLGDRACLNRSSSSRPCPRQSEP